MLVFDATMAFNTKMISSMTWMIQGNPIFWKKKHIWLAKNKPNNPFPKKQ